MRKITRLALALLASILGGCSSPGTWARSEVMLRQEDATIDLKVQGDLSEKAKAFFRARTGIDYEENKAYPFALCDLTYSLGPVDAVAEAQVSPETGIVPRAGVQADVELGDFYLYGLITAKAKEDTDVEITTLLRYCPKLGEDVSLYTELETATMWNEEGHVYSQERAKAGFKFGRTTFGVGADILITGDGRKGNSVETDYAVGPFFQVEF